MIVNIKSLNKHADYYTDKKNCWKYSEAYPFFICCAAIFYYVRVLYQINIC